MIRKIVNNAMAWGKFRIKGGKRWKDSIRFDIRVDEMTFG